ncbi:MAG: hypothetical protein OEY01_06230, partial [Desulfobulbaceae bacterium]|nr:hypothetical protein [Desulfobulbaceae bacterium]HIJ78708.1 hypothetical protein [Deltaproteobacteria bacterium]
MNRFAKINRALSVMLISGSVFLVGCAGMGPNGEKQAMVAGRPGVSGGCVAPNPAVASYFELIDTAPPELLELMTLFPKGGDIHNHLSGTIMPEDYISLGAKDGDCYDPTSYKITSPPCTSSTPALAQAGPADIQKLMASLSMYQFDYLDIQAGHDHFFATFGKFGTVSGANQGIMLAKLLQQAEADGVDYVETMMSFQSRAVSALAAKLQQKYPPTGPYYTDSRYFPEMYEFLMSAGLDHAVPTARMDIFGYQNIMNKTLGCGASEPDPACGVFYRFLAAANRNAALPKLYTQAALSFLLASVDDRVAGVNLVSGEDASTSMQDFAAQMEIFGFFHNKFPSVNIALHAGEITPCFVGQGNPALKDHITGSINAGAKRIGHGISFAYLDDKAKAEVVALMKNRDALVEILFASNAQILGVTGDEHPFTQYFREHGLPTAFSTDDEGVSYSNYTAEWLYAVLQYNLTYDELVELARFSLQYSFLPGDPLWVDVPAAKAVEQCNDILPGGVELTPLCRAFLQNSEKASMQWWYEA